MARRKKRTRTFRPAAPILIALVLLAVIVWAIVPRRHHTAVHRTPVQPVAAITPPAAATASPAAVTPAPSAAPQIVTPAPAVSGHARLAIIIDDCGQWPQVEKALIALPIPLTMSVMPHVRYTAEIAGLAADAGKGVMLHLPMEPLSHRVSGPGEIRVAMTDANIAAQTRDDLAQVPLAQGVNNHEGSAASADRRVMSDVMQILKDRGLFFIDSRTNAATVAAATATADGVPNASRDVFLDNQADTAYSEAMLRDAARIALVKGSAIAIGHPKPTTLAAIRALYPELQAKGIEFVPVATLVK